ncbi:hypothetical protein [Bradyrhizobium japonicum]|uniref:hypothetical protein n=1 Tax=Bradyrhizobium japonicum TaxID=375 RepID=UPI0011800B4E|nr:hypothetical protein [Bradyrhizobium japonicum]
MRIAVAKAIVSSSSSMALTISMWRFTSWNQDMPNCLFLVRRSRTWPFHHLRSCLATRARLSRITMVKLSARKSSIAEIFGCFGRIRARASKVAFVSSEGVKSVARDSSV